jgi:hypothetical protein
MDFKKVNKKALVEDLVKVATFNIVAHVLMSIKYGDELFSDKFVYSLIFILIGFTVYHVLLDSRVRSLFKTKENWDGLWDDKCNKNECIQKIGDFAYKYTLVQKDRFNKEYYVERRLYDGTLESLNSKDFERALVTDRDRSQRGQHYNFISVKEQACCDLKFPTTRYIDFGKNKILALEYVRNIDNDKKRRKQFPFLWQKRDIYTIGEWKQQN